MSVLIVPGDRMRTALPMPSCIDAMEDALRSLARGEATLPLRSILWRPDRSGLLGLMPASLQSPPCWGVKVITVMPGNKGTAHDSHQGAVLLFEPERGCLLAILDATSLTEIRTGAVSAVATRALARADAGDLAILGSGVQARSHLEAMRAVRTLRRVRVWSPNAANAGAFAARESGRSGLLVEAVPSARAAVEGADLICTATAAREPILLGEWIAEGAHVNAVGACVAAARELDTAAVARSLFYVDSRESARSEAGDFLIPRAEGAVGDDHIRGELGEVLIGAREGRRSPQDRTVFKSLGLAVEDLAAAHLAYRNAAAEGAGWAVDLGGRRADDR